MYRLGFRFFAKPPPLTDDETMADTSPTLADLVDLGAQLRRDEVVNDRELRVRDRAIGKTLDGPADPASRVVGWLRRVESDATPRLGERADAARRVGVGLLVGIGLVLGWASALAVFHYDGDDPVNVVRVLGFYVALQGLLVLLTVGAMLPLGRSVRDTLSLLSPGRLLPLLVRVLPRDYRDALDHALGRSGTHQRVYGRLQKWLVLLAAQGFATAFNIGALAGAMQLIVTTDLAFGWSTTLQTSEEQFTAIVQALALPWAWAWRDAEPGLELVIATQYFRAQPTLGENYRQYGQWWPFLMMCMVTYGLLPRVILGIVARVRFAAALRHSMLTTPGVAQLLDRLNVRAIEHTAATTEPMPDIDGPDSPHERIDDAPPLQAGAVINWSGVPVDETRLGLGSIAVLPAGGARTLEQDRETIAAASSSNGRAGGVLILVRAWEPPMLELVDFVTELRVALGEGVPIAVVPVRVEADTPARASGSERHQWQRMLAKANDPWLRVTAWEGGDT